MEENRVNYRLMKYAFYAGQSSHPSTTDWKVYDGSSKELQLSITGNHHLLVTFDKEILENMSMWNSRSWMKALSKGDSMLFISKHQEMNRRFRVKFKEDKENSAVNVRKHCVQKLVKYFPVTMLDGSGVTEQSDSQGDLKDEVSVGKLAEVLSGTIRTELPSIYGSTPVPTEALESLVTLCLTDSNFPGFVSEVEKQLIKLTEK